MKKISFCIIVKIKVDILADTLDSLKDVVDELHNDIQIMSKILNGLMILPLLGMLRITMSRRTIFYLGMLMIFTRARTEETFEVKRENG